MKRASNGRGRSEGKGGKPKFESANKKGFERRKEADSKDKKGVSKFKDKGKSGENDKRELAPNSYFKKFEKPKFEKEPKSAKPEKVRKSRNDDFDGSDDFELKPKTRRTSKFDKPETGFVDRKTFVKKEERIANKGKKDFQEEKPARAPKSFSKGGERKFDKPKFGDRRNSRRDEEVKPTKRKGIADSLDYTKDKINKPKGKGKFVKSEFESTETRLNKYIANAGICSRREADELIAVGAVKVNGQIVTELGYKIKLGDIVHYGEQLLRSEKPVYLLLNKPKDFITTSDDPDNRKTVMDLVRNACKERIYPVGRLDRNTTGLLLFTNDGDMAKKLTHPKYGVKKIYHVSLDKNVAAADMKLMLEGLKLEEDFVKADEVAYVGEDEKDKSQVGVEIHTGQNRVVRRMFEHFGYKVVKLDRVYYAGLTKKDLPRGHYRFLNEREISMLKMLRS